MKLLLALFVGLFITTFNLHTAQAEERYAAVNFYADWCGSCKILDPKVEEARTGSDLEDIAFYTFDMSDSESIARTKKLAAAESIDPLLQIYGAATGFLVLYDREKNEVVKTITSAYGTDDIKTEFHNLQESKS